MSRKLLIALAALATALATAIPAGAGPVEIAAQTDNTEAPYVVVMEAAPVLGNEEIAPEGGDPPDPDSAAVEEYEAELEAEKVEALTSAGIKPETPCGQLQFARQRVRAYSGRGGESGRAKGRPERAAERLSPTAPHLGVTRLPRSRRSQRRLG